ncbi:MULTISPECIES: nuclear transport factor 2 family protein [unclassified Burkholderia]|uniref:nuclear transport factor 2 family protein n=2 Tax=unclassified Burkholderia TaxID=2613784 RepID=UPI000757CFF5|nr:MULTISPECIES: nuclear transport factor 2 family protein [unclassified Burkholderia]KUY62072.1 hypothetical protein WS45_04275 [Burkholderia sp. RF2-non_BP3]KUY81217.1 hypothetical protein WS46_17305 [Burkholderia sp. RF4-BP95]KUY89479.1 hypothetical protein WS48_27985 [Burkholderia sp. RF7-non_BP1]KUY99510.1 hypothetical protein WS49_18395 [Burkholderia sp. RF7-non_BP4]
MQGHIEDHLAISDLMAGWMYRDLASWDNLADLFHPDATIEVTWFEGAVADFIAGSRMMGGSALHTKHLIGQPVIEFNGTKALVETNAIIVADQVVLKLGCAVHNRFYDFVEKRDGMWKIVRRQSIYDMGCFTFPLSIEPIDGDVVERFPPEYAALAYLLEKSGFPVRRVFATRGSALEMDMKQRGAAWLADRPANT